MLAEGRALYTFDASRQSPVCSVVVVSFYPFAKLPACLDVLRKDQTFEDLELTVVNNSIDDRVTISGLCADGGAMFIKNPSNTDYGWACKIGALHSTAEFLLFLNPKVRISHASIEMLVKLAKANPDLVALGPIQRNLSGKIYGKRRANGHSKSASTSSLRALEPVDTLIDTKLIWGGALMVRKDAFDRVGDSDSQLLLFHEDDDLCLQSAGLGRIAYAADVVALHDWGSSTPASSKVTYARSWHLGFSKIHVLRKHCDHCAASRVLLEAGLKLLSPAMLISRGRTKASAFRSGTLAALRNPERVAEMVPA